MNLFTLGLGITVVLLLTAMVYALCNIAARADAMDEQMSRRLEQVAHAPDEGMVGK